MYLCTTLHASGCPPAMIQALLRWQTDESLKEYTRLTYAMYTGFLEGAAAVTDLQTMAAAGPPVDPPELAVEALDNMEGIRLPPDER